jgi:hypothetical protein
VAAGRATGACKLGWRTSAATLTEDSPAWPTIDLPRESMGASGVVPECLDAIIEHDGDDVRLPDAVREFNGRLGASCSSRRCASRRERSGGSRCRASPARICERRWRQALLDATARQATLALYCSRLVDQTCSSAAAAVLEERNSIARDIHDTLAQGFGAILMQTGGPAAERRFAVPGGGARPRAAVDLARPIWWRRADRGRPPAASGEREDVVAALNRMVGLARRPTMSPSSSSSMSCRRSMRASAGDRRHRPEASPTPSATRGRAHHPRQRCAASVSACPSRTMGEDLRRAAVGRFRHDEHA